MKTPKNSTLKSCVWETTSYGMFNYIPCNRDIVKSHIKRLAEEMTKKELEQPIMVKENGDGKYDIMEGQHRYAVAKENNLPVYFQIENTLELDDIITMNTVKLRTKNRDYLKWFYIQAKNGVSKYNNYITFDDYIKKYSLENKMHFAIMLIEGTYMRQNPLWENFRIGKLEIKDYKKSCRLIEQFDDIGTHFPDYRKVSQSNFYAFMEAFNCPEYDHKRMMNQLAKPIVVLTKQIDKEAYQKQIHRAYNKQMKNSKINLFNYLAKEKKG